MTDDEQRLQQHWQELAEQLGIDSPPPAPPIEEKSIAKSARANPASVPARPATNRDAAETESRKEEATWPAEDQSPSGSPTTFDDAATPAWEAEERPVTEETPDEISDREAPSEERPPRRPGRKSAGGARQRRSSDRTLPGEPGESTEEDSAPRARRRRKETASGHRARKEEASAPFNEVEPEEPQAPPEAIPEEADDLDTLTDWNVPSWTELIDSLYRPDR